MKLSHILPAVATLAGIAGVAALIRAAAEWRALHLLGVRRIVELQRELAEARRCAAAWQGLAAEALKKAATLVDDAEPVSEPPREEMAVTHGYADGPDMPQTVFDPPRRPTGAEYIFARYHPERRDLADLTGRTIGETDCPVCGKYDVPCFAETTAEADDLRPWSAWEMIHG